MARERGCAQLIGHEDLANVGKVAASAAGDMKKEINDVLDMHVMADKGPWGALIAPVFPTYAIMASGVVAQIAPLFTQPLGVWGIVLAGAAGAGINSIALIEAASIAHDYYEEKAQRVCSKTGAGGNDRGASTSTIRTKCQVARWNRFNRALERVALEEGHRQRHGR
ncbi:MAG TPA: hypothetical protein VFE23_17115 [Usitatibacter sp.]|jgi:hypothetical protein|nr:hypothetical protein [Usitatibacter sp.]